MILSIDTSAAHCAVAVHRGTDLRAYQLEEMRKGQAERLFPLCEEQLESAETKWAELSAIAVCVGPGNFTGVRIGVSAARGLALSLGIPAIGVTRLEAMSYGSNGAQRVILDARRNRAFHQDFNDSRALAPATIGPLIQHNATTYITEPTDQHLITIGKVAPPQYPVAQACGLIALGKLDQENPRPAPLYLMAADAAPSSIPAPKIIP
ncbi:tRNA N6-adenosine(37)-N6-threonylcarbamoyltransferase complex dimerization subunit TsaB [Amylibacter marinus]|uniref:tRNA N6-adenosine(37)-N6-threonylcarbamoyltransferase complex dimerization subunit TsaB n=1 Tax=Amylibacter marinus TaxID=1475483 RepID=A0ABQ5VT99_9RHOB|nr:tRNA (adenosine(37)-N6)-threonylcarbamoyltransferase complex dimerization subunit type 1 TsaB [Amylibacter marinus]GLQ34495.1 tRNA N6-adenosine(37)-N6-threonylcarbamoyltransferase complex dimerization subunit TsaB [Amylibacter marinus]